MLCGVCTRVWCVSVWGGAVRVSPRVSLSAVPMGRLAVPRVPPQGYSTGMRECMTVPPPKANDTFPGRTGQSKMLTFQHPGKSLSLAGPQGPPLGAQGESRGGPFPLCARFSGGAARRGQAQLPVPTYREGRSSGRVSFCFPVTAARCLCN